MAVLQHRKPTPYQCIAATVYLVQPVLSPLSRRTLVQADYHPSELLCPTALCWVPAARCLAALAKDGFVELSELPDALDGLGSEQVPPWVLTDSRVCTILEVACVRNWQVTCPQ